MADYNEIQGFAVNKMTKKTYDELKASGSLKSNEVYIVLRGDDPTGLPNYESKAGYVLKVNSDGTDVEWQRELGGTGDAKQAAVFTSLSAMTNTLNNSPADTYSVGQNIFIAEQNVPDFWIYSVDEDYLVGKTPNEFEGQFYKFGYYTLALLEVGKVLFNSNITYSDKEPVNAKLGDIWLAPAEEIINELPEYTAEDAGKVLEVNSGGSLYWNKSTPVEANPPLDGSETDLTSVKIDGVLYELKGQGGQGSVEMIFSDTPNTSATSLRTITIGDDVWSIPLGGGSSEGGGSVDLTGYATEEYVNSQGFITARDLPSLDNYAEKSYVSTAIDDKIEELVGFAPDRLDTLEEISAVISKNEDTLSLLNSAVLNKQDILISGVNIKTINGKSIIGEGNLEIAGGSGDGEVSSNVVANAPLIGLEEELTSLKVNDTTYAIPSEAMVFSNEEVSSANILRSIRAGDYIWKIAAGGEVDLTPYATKESLNNNVQSLSSLISNNYEVLDSNKQEILESGVNIKTINGKSLLGEGNIDIDLDLGGYATEEYISQNYASKDELVSEIAKLLNDAPEAYDTLKELSDAIIENEDLLETLNSAIDNKANKDNVVDLTTGQNIGGMKTFTGSVVIASETLGTKSPELYLKASDCYANISVDDNINNSKALTIKTYKPEYETTRYANINFVPGSNESYISLKSGSDHYKTELLINGSEQEKLLLNWNDTNGSHSEIVLNSGNVKTINGISIYGKGDIELVDKLYLEAYAVNYFLKKIDFDIYYTELKSNINTVKSDIEHELNLLCGARFPDTNFKTITDICAAIDYDPEFYKTINTRFENMDNEKQNILVSGVNIKTIGGQPILGFGDLDISTSNMVSIKGNQTITGIKTFDNKIQLSNEDTTFGYLRALDNGSSKCVDLFNSPATDNPDLDGTNYSRMKLYVGADYHNLALESRKNNYYSTLEMNLGDVEAGRTDISNALTFSYGTNSLASKIETIAHTGNLKTVNGVSLVGSGDIALTPPSLARYTYLYYPDAGPEITLPHNVRVSLNFNDFIPSSVSYPNALTEEMIKNSIINISSSSGLNISPISSSKQESGWFGVFGDNYDINAVSKVITYTSSTKMQNIGVHVFGSEILMCNLGGFDFTTGKQDTSAITISSLYLDLLGVV